MELHESISAGERIDMSREDMLKAAVAKNTDPIFRTSKAEIVDYYKDTYKGKWASQAAKDLSGTTDTKSRDYKSARRNFEGSRISQEGKTAKWREFGKTLPPIGRKLRDNSITITVEGKQIRDGKKPGQRDRTIVVTFRGSDALTFIEEPTFQDIWDEYQFDFDEAEDGEYSLTVTNVR